MIALLIIGIILLILLLICSTRFGAIASYDGKFTLRLRIGFITITPMKKKKAIPKKESLTVQEDSESAKKKKTFPGPTFDELMDLLSFAFTALEKSMRGICKKLKIDPFAFGVIIGGNDPADIAIAYGYANAALRTFMPCAEELFTIPSPSIHLGVDYEAKKTTVSGTLGVSIRIGALLAIAFTLAMPVFKWYKRVKKAHRNDMVNQPVTNNEQAQNLTA